MQRTAARSAGLGTCTSEALGLSLDAAAYSRQYKPSLCLSCLSKCRSTQPSFVTNTVNLSLRESEQKGATHHVEVLQARAVHDLQGPQVDHVQDLGLREKHLLVPVTTVLTTHSHHRKGQG